MKQGLTLEELAAELVAQRERQRDYVIDSRELRMLTSGGDTPHTELLLPGSPEAFPTEHFHRQLGTHLGVRSDLYDRLRSKHGPLYDHLVNGLLEREPARRMIRTYVNGGPGDQPVARAFLSDSYRRIDNYPLAQSILPIIGRIPGVQVPSCQVTEKKLYIKVVVPGVAFDLNDLRRRYGGGGGGIGAARLAGEDVVQAGLLIENSEVGAGSLTVSDMVHRLVCLNGMIVAKAIARRHVGTQIGEVGEDYSIYRDETIVAADRALMMRVEDAVTAAVDEKRFELLAIQFGETMSGEKMARPIEAMKILGKQLSITETEQENVLAHLIEGGDLSRFGAINAITRAAQDVESYDRSVELEEAGGLLMAMAPREWDQIAVAA